MNRLFRDVGGGPRCPHGSVVCIGAFDGLHLGHQALVRHAVSRARALDLPALALSFEPLPRELFARGAPPPRLLGPRAKVLGLCGLGADRVGLLRFRKAMAALDAGEFVERILVEHLRVREVWTGPGFGFGKGRGGNLELLQRMGRELGAAGQGFTAGEIDTVTLEGERISATRIRELLQAGEFGHAARLLGRPYSISGKVVHGARLGRTLGYPTANLRLHGRAPLSGIFATRVHGIDGSRVRCAYPGYGGGSGDGQAGWPSVASLGTRPTVDGGEPLLEVHLFDFDGDLYGRRIEVEFVGKLRDEVRFDSLPALVEQMHDDSARARALLSQQPNRVPA
ncbi:riboflavin biosynthesis protein RibF [Lysobacter sp. GX 14042]|uniref:riboflavin biosynthesis protein RibF n=1 Tax=Lysobacter sp. GX 14042 TaxID=2907155 RepID=UPI001F010C18|nr:riboflavin biosynthesis protein RibF [Lysobacter sp. GX 14042]MCE7032719.1 riboflavin biosynthesis protein RibF [Lysobacter sp. GX 14042]